MLTERPTHPSNPSHLSIKTQRYAEAYKPNPLYYSDSSNEKKGDSGKASIFAEKKEFMERHYYQAKYSKKCAMQEMREGLIHNPQKKTKRSRMKPRSRRRNSRNDSRIRGNCTNLGNQASHCCASNKSLRR